MNHNTDNRIKRTRVKNENNFVVVLGSTAKQSVMTSTKSDSDDLTVCRCPRNQILKINNNNNNNNSENLARLT